MTQTSETDGPKRIQSIERAVLVVETLSKHGSLSVGEMQEITGLPFATLRRILETLRDKGWVRRWATESRYELPFSFGKMLATQELGRPLAEVVGPLIQELTTRTNFPIMLGMATGPGQIEIVETTIVKGEHSPLSTTYGLRPSMVYAAIGTAYLAHCSDEEFAKHQEALMDHGRRAERQFIQTGELDAELVKIKKQGYATRPSFYQPEPFEDGTVLSAISVPIHTPQKIYGTLGCSWPSNKYDNAEVIDLMLPELQNIAQVAAQKLSRMLSV